MHISSVCCNKQIFGNAKTDLKLDVLQNKVTKSLIQFSLLILGL